MAKATINTGEDAQPVHTRTTADSAESQVVVLGVDGSDTVVDPRDLATAAKQDLAKAVLDNLLTELGQKVEAADLAGLATAAKQDILAGHVDGLEGTNASILAKLIAAPATEGKQDTQITSLASILTSVDGVEALLTAIDGHVDGLEGKDFATQTTLALMKTALDSVNTSTDGLESVEGATADAVVAAGAAGSHAAKLRRVTQGLEDLKSLIVLGAGSNAIGKLAANSGVDIGDVDVTSVPADPFGANADAAVAAGATGSIQAKLRRLTTDLDAVKTAVQGATPAGTNAIGTVELAGSTPVQFLDVDETEDEVKATAGKLHHLFLANLSAGVRYVKLYDGPAASIAVGTDTPKATYPLAAGEKLIVSLPRGLTFASGICIAATTGIAVADTGAPGVNDVVASVSYS